jgi:hypothetical protein
MSGGEIHPIISMSDRGILQEQTWLSGGEEAVILAFSTPGFSIYILAGGLGRQSNIL